MKHLIAFGALAFTLAGCVTTPVDPDDVPPPQIKPGPTRDIPAATSGVKVVSHPLLSYCPTADGKDITFQYGLELENDSNAEVADIAVSFEMGTTSGQVLASAPEQHLNLFNNHFVPLQGSLQPHSKAAAMKPVSVTIPSGTWRTDSVPRFTITKCSIYPDPQDLHIPGHLFAAAASWPAGKLKEALERDPSLLDVGIPMTGSAVLIAASSGDVDAVKFVVAHGGKLKDVSRDGEGAMAFATASDSPKMHEYLHSQGLSLDERSLDKKTPLIRAIIAGHFEEVKWLLKNGASPNLSDEFGFPALAYALTDEQFPAFHLLLKSGAETHFHTTSGYGPMHLAIASPEMLPEILGLGIKVDDHVGPLKQTALQQCAATARYPAARWLIAHGASLTYRDTSGQNAYDYAKAGTTLNTDRFFREGIGQPTPSEDVKQ